MRFISSKSIFLGLDNLKLHIIFSFKYLRFTFVLPFVFAKYLLISATSLSLDNSILTSLIIFGVKLSI